MRSHIKSILVALALTACVSTAPTFNSAASPESAYPIGKKGSNAKAVGRLFEIDGHIKYFAGTNAWWLAHLSNNKDVDQSLKEIRRSHYKTIRVWGFGDVTDATLPAADASDPDKVYFQYLNATGGYINYGTEGIQRLDYVVSAAEEHGLKLVLPFVNNWNNYGGIATYNSAFGGNATTWFTDTVSQKVYRNYIKFIVTRYKKSSAIFAWELANEPRCRTCPTSVIYNWASDVSKFIKSLDPDHMVTLGDEGWLTPADGYGDGSYAYSAYEGVDFAMNLNIPTLDYGVFHMYPDQWGYNYTWGTEWIQQHDEIGAKAQKPVILEEYGSPFPHNHTGIVGPWQDAVLKSGLAADQNWQFGPADISINPSKLSDVYTIFYNDTEYQTLGKEHAKEMSDKNH